MPASVRRSGRKRTQNPRYSGDVSRFLDEIDPEATLEALDANDDQKDTDAHVSVTGDSENGDSDVSFREGTPEGDEVSENDDMDLRGSDTDAPLTTIATRTRLGRTGRINSASTSRHKADESYHTRGLPHYGKLQTWTEVVAAFSGNDKRDRERLDKELGHWRDKGPLPTRAAMVTAPSSDEFEQEAMSQATHQLSAWYGRGGEKLAATLQSPLQLSWNAGEDYYLHQPNAHKTIMGPHWNPKLFELSQGHPFHLAEAWKHDREPQSEDNGNLARSAPAEPERNGWMIYLGSKVQSLAWVPCRESDTQYLAIALESSEPKGALSHNALEPSSRYKSCIQIWKFIAQNDVTPRTLKPDTQPVLVHVMCTEWGMCSEIKWCPGISADSGPAHSPIHLGLMATVWSDGYARVLDVGFHEPESDSSPYVKYCEAIFASKPPRSICTTVAWSTSTDLIGGCANGKIAIWNIIEGIEMRMDLKEYQPSGAPRLREPIPYLYHQLHDTYILAMTACLPHHPYLLISSSVDGHYRLCDLRDPLFDTVESRRYRHYALAFDYSPQLRGAMAPDGQDITNFLQVRRFFAELTLATSPAIITAVTCGQASPYVVIGSADGSAVIFNPVPRITKTRNPPPRWEYTWFKHEWMPESGPGSAEYIQRSHNEEDRVPGEEQGAEALPRRNAIPGISRITDSFAPQQYGAKKSAAKKSANASEGISARWQTIYEEPSAITQLQWNPNYQCGGWVAAGMGSGLLRVEDLAI